MTDEQKAALEWLRRQCFGSKDACTIQDMLAEPRLPAEPTRDAVRAMHQGYRDCAAGGEFTAEMYRALYAHLTAPRTKTVEVWHVEYTHYTNPSLVIRGTQEAAEKSKQQIIADGCECVRVTGPHQHEVPA